jgi:PAS domain-containing protein
MGPHGELARDSGACVNAAWISEAPSSGQNSLKRPAAEPASGPDPTAAEPASRPAETPRVAAMSVQKPLELILARNLLSSISTPAFLVEDSGGLLFYNEAAGALLGRRFEETGTMDAADWTRAFGPFDDDDKPIPYEQIPATIALRENQPFHGNFRICGAGGRYQDIAASAIPIVGYGGSSGAIVIFWPVTGN